MKKRVLALILAAALAVGMATTGLAASGYPDVVGRWSQPYVEDMTRRGLYNGYTDGNFHPADPLTAAQAISICVRMSAFDEAAKKAAIDDWYDAVYEAVGGEQSWFHEDFAVAVAAGIVTVDELEGLHLSGKLAKGLTREEFSEYLVRALQIETPEEAPELDFADAESIATVYVIPVYVLSSAGIVVGSLENGILNFNPKKIINREESATMFSRAVDYIDRNQLIIELYDYADYTVQSGEIVSFENSVLTIENAVTGKTAIELPKTAEVYEGNILAGTDSLEAGRVARVCSNAAGVFAVRVYDGGETVYTGALREYDGERVNFHTGTRAVTLELDRQTVISAGGKTGGTEVYDEEADYSAVTATVDPTGRMTALRFEGGSRAESVFLRAVGEDRVLTVATHGGEEMKIKLADDAEVVLPKDVKTLGSSSVGRRMDVRIDNVTGEIVKLVVDGENSYIHGGFVRTTVRTNSRTITLENTSTGSDTGYKMSAEVEVKIYNETTGKMETKRIGDLVEGQYITALTDKDGVVIEIEAYPGSSTFEGMLTSITYGKTIEFVLTSGDGETREYSFAAGEVPTIKRGNRVITADKLREGDLLTVNEKYSKITLITASAAEADFTAVVEGISITTSGTTLSLKLDETGKTEVYPLSGTAEILGADGSATALANIQGMKVAVTLSGDTVVLIEVKGAATTGGEIVGTVLFVNTVDRTLLVQQTGGSQMTISVPYSAAIMGVGGGTVNFTSIEAEDTVTVYGDFAADGAFTANIVIVK